MDRGCRRHRGLVLCYSRYGTRSRGANLRHRLRLCDTGRDMLLLVLLLVLLVHKVVASLCVTVSLLLLLLRCCGCSF